MQQGIGKSGPGGSKACEPSFSEEMGKTAQTGNQSGGEMESGVESGNSVEPGSGFDAEAEKKRDKGRVDGAWGGARQGTRG